MNQQEFQNKMKGMDFDAITRGLSEGTAGITSMFQKLADESMKIQIPKAKKDVELDGLNVAVGLIADGRVFIQFPSTDAAEAFYNSLGTKAEKKSFLKTIFK